MSQIVTEDTLNVNTILYMNNCNPFQNSQVNVGGVQFISGGIIASNPSSFSGLLDISSSTLSGYNVDGFRVNNGAIFVSIIDAAEPSVGQVLTATSNTTATWQTSTFGTEYTFAEDPTESSTTSTSFVQ
jgi:hypothetical protein